MKDCDGNHTNTTEPNTCSFCGHVAIDYMLNQIILENWFLQERAKSGQFLPGHKGMGGRPKEVRNKLADEAIRLINQTLESHGQESIERLATETPHLFWAVVSKQVEQWHKSEDKRGPQMTDPVELDYTGFEDGRLSDPDADLIREAENVELIPESPHTYDNPDNDYVPVGRPCTALMTMRNTVTMTHVVTHWRTNDAGPMGNPHTR